jgi:hypothetical protein
MCFDETMFQMGAAYEVCGMRDTGPYDWPGIAGGKYALAIHTRPLTLTWEELLEFVQDPTVGAWTNEAVHRWREGRH